MKETRVLSVSDLRMLCIENDWYTCGDNEDYARLLLKAANADNVTTELIVQMAEDIKAHSDTDDDLTSICFEIARKCRSHFE